ncbi:MAG: hypoxanthine phosphoribosyltransferase [Actinobacteria bacterium]|nr:hypoxanthine phosphoribosyltransferase [Actinomycetota bacterium]MDI6831547.1 hypoxanthine phosphoribosyltransferase [Actinomycetota bacterium]
MMEDKKAARVLISEEEIRRRTAELAREITRDYAGRELVMVGVLKGAFVFLADLARQVELPLEIDFVAVSSYGADTRSSGVVRIIKDLDLDISDKHVLLVEDIVDTGLTLKYLVGLLEERGPASVEICALLNKPEARKVGLEVKYSGFDVPPLFVVGYGLDHAERFRQLPYVGVLEDVEGSGKES